MILAAKNLSEQLQKLAFNLPITHIYNPLEYAWKAHELYLERYANSKKRIVFLGMNPGPWGMAQIGVPFGEIGLVRDWLKIFSPVGKPLKEHPKRPIEGFDCEKSEVSGRRLWSLFKDKFITPEAFFKDHFVANYCPLVFMEESGKNRTPDKLSFRESEDLYAYCDQHLREIVEILDPEYVIGVGAFAAGRAGAALKGKNVKIAQILHPSPASPAANKGWAEKATAQLKELGVW